MTKQKKSFLDKIINNSDNKEDSAKDDLIENEGKKNVDEVLSETEDGTLEDVANIEESKNKNRESGDIDDDKKEDWLNDHENSKEEEGQLTIDVYQTDNLIIIKSIIGGVRAEDLDISVTNDMVTIKGKRENHDDVKNDDYYYQECFWGNFSRSVILPSDIKTDDVEASIKNGILTVKMPKIEKNSSMKIKVKEE